MKKTNLFSFVAGLICASIISLIIQKSTSTKIDKSEELKCTKHPAEELLPPPEWSDKLPARLETNYQGQVTIMWKEVPYAYRYYVRVYNQKGKMIRKWKTKYDVVYADRLPFDKDQEFTPFKITVSTQNYLEKDGSESEPKTLYVRRLTNLLAPAIESVEIED